VADESVSPAEATALGLVGLAALAGAGLFAAGRVRRRRRLMADDGTAVMADDTAVVDPVVAEPIPAEVTVPSAWTPAPIPASPESFRMPSGPVPIGAERDALLARMVAAPPDEANPFRSTKARRRRARMILATRERELAANARAPFDWRTYEPSGKVTEPATVPAES